MTYHFEHTAPRLAGEFRAEEHKDYLLRGELQRHVVGHAVVVPPRWQGDSQTGVLTPTGAVVPSSTPHELLTEVAQPQASQVVDEDVTAIFVGHINRCWGHLITDALKKFWFLHTAEGRRCLAAGARIVYIPTEGQTLSQPARELFALAGLEPKDFVPVTRPTRFREVIVPESSFQLHPDGFYYSQEYLDQISAIRDAVAGQGTTERVYYTRSRFASWRRDVGESRLEAVYRDEGFTVVAPETLSVAEQIHLLKGCRHLVTTEGSIAHNALFCQPGTRLTLLMKVDRIYGYQIAVNQIADLDVTYIRANRTTPTHASQFWSGPFYLCVTPELEHALGRRLPHVPYGLDPRYWLHRATVVAKRLRDGMRRLSGRKRQ